MCICPSIIIIIIIIFCYRVSDVSSREPAVSTVGLGSESSPGSVISEEAYRPQFTTDHHHGLSFLTFLSSFLKLLITDEILFHLPYQSSFRLF